jgi:hypothetical protein
MVSHQRYFEIQSFWKKESSSQSNCFLATNVLWPLLMVTCTNLDLLSAFKVPQCPCPNISWKVWIKNWSMKVLGAGWCG